MLTYYKYYKSIIKFLFIAKYLMVNLFKIPQFRQLTITAYGSAEELDTIAIILYFL